MEDLLKRVRESAEAHRVKASEYEAAGNTQGAMYLRYVSNLLYALADGKKGETILP